MRSGDRVGVDVEAADLLVQVDELRGRDLALLQRLRPYCTPTLSIGRPAKPWPTACSVGDQSAGGRGPKRLIAASWMAQRTPPGLVCGSVALLLGGDAGAGVCRDGDVELRACR